MHLKTSLRHILLKRSASLHYFSQRLPLSTQHERVYESVYPALSIPQQNTADYCMSRFDTYAPYPALECSLTGKRLTYADVRSMTQKFGSQLLASGLKPGDRIAALVPNCPEFGPLLLGALGVGVTLVPISPVLGPKEVSSLLNISRPKMVVTNDALLPGLTEAIGLTRSGEQIHVITVTDDSKTGATPLSQFLQNDGAGYANRPSFDVDETLGILPFSSGTTGLPKGVMLSQSNLTSTVCLTNNVASGCAVGPFEPSSGEAQYNFLSVIPMFHIFGLTMNVLQPLSAGAHVITMPKFDPQHFLSNLSTFQPDFLTLVPPLVMMLAMNPAVTKEHLAGTRVISSGGSPVSTSILDKLREKMKPDSVIKEGYGMTECPIISRGNKSDNPDKKNSVGKIMPNISYKIVDIESGKSVDMGTPGELLIKAPHVMKGYFNNEEANKDSFSGDWFHTGDVVVTDEDGDIFIVDRIKDMIKVKGYQVSPTELEAEVRLAPGVADVAVIGVPHPQAGEAPRAFIVPSSADVTAESVQEFLSGRLAKYKQLTGGIVIMESLPKSPTGKVLRKELRAL